MSSRERNLSYRSIHPSAIERQKVSLMCDVLNEKTVAALRMDGCSDTAKFLEICLRLWNIFNIKRTDTHIRLNDPNRMPFSNAADGRLVFMTDVAEGLSMMQGGRSFSRNKSLTTETKEAFMKTIHGMVYLIRKMLLEDHQYVLPGVFQTDRLEGEFGIHVYR